MSEETNVEETTQETVENQTETPQEESQQEEQPQEAPSNVSIDEDGTIKLDLRETVKTEEDAVQEQETTSVDVGERTTDSEEVDEEVRSNNDESPVVELVQEEELEAEAPNTLLDKIKDIPNKLKEQEEDVNNNQEVPVLPENINKLIEFMEETGGSVEDYVSLNKDYDSMDNMELLREYYQQTKPHLATDEIEFLIEDNFSYDEDVDDERDIKRKKLAFKESIAEAKSNLSNLKDKYYDELKLSSKLNPEQREAIEFYNDYKTNQTSKQQQRSVFEQKTSELFSNEFKGFEFNVGESKYRYNVKDVDKVKDSQSDINTLVSKFVNENNEISDAKGYHKALFTAMNADAIANHFYEQGKADAVKSQMKTSKNIDMNPRSAHEKVTTSSGMQVRALSGDDASRLRFKIKN